MNNMNRVRNIPEQILEHQQNEPSKLWISLLVFVRNFWQQKLIKLISRFVGGGVFCFACLVFVGFFFEEQS